jgi:hypothetical protein
MVESPVLTNVKATFGGLDVYDVEPQALPDVLGERPVIVFGKWRGEAEGPRDHRRPQRERPRTARKCASTTAPAWTPPHCVRCGPAIASRA